MRFKPPHKCDLEKLSNVCTLCLSSFLTTFQLLSLFLPLHTSLISYFQPTLERQVAEKSESAPPETGEGSEYGRQWREEARRRKRGYANRKSEPDDNPWVLKEKKKGGKQ